jgi:hypothetical protein
VPITIGAGTSGDLTLILACFFIPIDIFWYGRSSYARTSWVVPEFGTVPMGIGNNTLMMCATTYLIGAHVLYEASAVAACTAVGSLIGAPVLLAGRSMYEEMELGWGNSLLAFLA